MPERGDPTPGLHRVLDRCGAVTEERGGRVDVRDDVGDPPERRWTLARRLRRTDDLDDHLPEPEEDLADRSSAEFAVPFPARVHTDAASDSTVRPRSGDSSTTWSIAVTPFACVAGGAATALRRRRRDAVEVIDRAVRRQAAQRPPDDAGAAATPDQPDANTADPADGIGVDAEPRLASRRPPDRRPRARRR